MRITSGCTTTSFCPNDTILRGQMAVFVVRALQWALTGTPENFAYSTSPYFTDVPTSHPFFKYIQKMKELGITGGCTTSTYCPDDTLSWGQMTTFGVRAWEYRTRGQVTNTYCTSKPYTAACIPNTNPRLDNFVPARATPVYFPNDVPTDHVFHNYIQKAINANLVDLVPGGKSYGGCFQQPRNSSRPPPGQEGVGNYCTAFPISRGDASYLVVRGAMGVFDPYSPQTFTPFGYVAGISPGRAETNLGPIPFGKYDDLHYGVAEGMTTCRDTALTVRGCIKRFFGADASEPTYRASNYVQQGIKGVRFFFPMGDPAAHHSTQHLVRREVWTWIGSTGSSSFLSISSRTAWRESYRRRYGRAGLGLEKSSIVAMGASPTSLRLTQHALRHKSSSTFTPGCPLG
ncbi:MAG: S-layer homology domain-containing protein [Acidobacteria bacterium]|nr:S-layer homology domain-containing protein [Acidobacteriota bacterium]